MNFTKYTSLKPKENPHGVDVREIYNHEDAQIVHMILEPGQALKPHSTMVDVFMYILEGVSVIYIADEIIEADADTIIESSKDIVHWIENTGAVKARILV